MLPKVTEVPEVLPGCAVPAQSEQIPASQLGHTVGHEIGDQAPFEGTGTETDRVGLLDRVGTDPAEVP